MWTATQFSHFCVPTCRIFGNPTLAAECMKNGGQAGVCKIPRCLKSSVNKLTFGNIHDFQWLTLCSFSVFNWAKYLFSHLSPLSPHSSRQGCNQCRIYTFPAFTFRWISEKHIRVLSLTTRRNHLLSHTACYNSRISQASGECLPQMWSQLLDIWEHEWNYSTATVDTYHICTYISALNMVHICWTSSLDF